MRNRVARPRSDLRGSSGSRCGEPWRISHTWAGRSRPRVWRTLGDARALSHPRQPLWYFSMMQPRSSRSGPRLDIEAPATRRAGQRPRLAVVHARALHRPVPPVEFDDDGHPCRDGCTEGGRDTDRRARGTAAIGRAMMFTAGSGRRNAVDALGCRGRLGGDRGHRANGCVLTTRPAIAR